MITSPFLRPKILLAEQYVFLVKSYICHLLSKIIYFFHNTIVKPMAKNITLMIKWTPIKYCKIESD